MTPIMLDQLARLLRADRRNGVVVVCRSSQVFRRIKVQVVPGEVLIRRAV